MGPCYATGSPRGLPALEDVTIQSLFTGGPEGNSSPEHVSAWVDRVKTFAPVFVQVYTLDCASPTRGLLPLDKGELLHIKSLLEKEGISSGVYSSVFLNLLYFFLRMRWRN